MEPPTGWTRAEARVYQPGLRLRSPRRQCATATGSVRPRSRKVASGSNPLLRHGCRARVRRGRSGPLGGQRSEVGRPSSPPRRLLPAGDHALAARRRAPGAPPVASIMAIFPSGARYWCPNLPFDRAACPGCLPRRCAERGGQERSVDGRPRGLRTRTYARGTVVCPEVDAGPWRHASPADDPRAQARSERGGSGTRTASSPRPGPRQCSCRGNVSRVSRSGWEGPRPPAARTLPDRPRQTDAARNDPERPPVGAPFGPSIAPAA